MGQDNEKPTITELEELVKKETQYKGGLSLGDLLRRSQQKNKEKATESD